MNLSELAALAGVSVGTVSKAFSGSCEISESTRERIFEIAREAGVFEKYDKGKFPKPVIGVICPEIGSNYYSTIVSMLGSRIEADGGIALICETGFDRAKETELFSYFSGYSGADGVILITPGTKHKNPTHFPAVSIGSAHESANMDVICLKLENAIEDALEHLKKNGHQSIGFAGEKLTRSKLDQFRSAMRRAGLPVEARHVKTSPNRFEQAGVDCAEAWLREGDLPDAILAAYDYIAIGIIKALHDHGVRVPEDVSVIGMDDIATAPYLETSLSSIRTNTEEACQRAVELIMIKTKNQYYMDRQKIVIQSEFIPRESSGPRSK